MELLKWWMWLSIFIFVFGALQAKKEKGDNVFKDLFSSFMVFPVLIGWLIGLCYKWVRDLVTYDPYKQNPLS